MGYSFKQYLLNEDRAYFGERIGDVLNAVQDLVDNGNSMGTRQLVKKSDGIVNQLRRILHTNWPKKNDKELEKLQDAAVAISRAIEEKDDLVNILTSVKGSLEELSTELGEPIQNTGKEDKDGGEEKGPEPSQPETKEEKPEQPQVPPPAPGQPPPGGQPPGAAPPMPGQLGGLPGGAPPGGAM